MKLITQQKPFDEIAKVIGKREKVFLAGCGTCAMICRTGGEREVLEMKERLQEAGKTVTGWTVIPMACDELTGEALNENLKAVEDSEVILVMSCAFGVQTLGGCTDKPVYPALNTLFIGKQEGPERFVELCVQCGECVLAETGGICPLTACPKGLLNGPCGSYEDGHCEISPDIPCAWLRIYEKLKGLGRLDTMLKIAPPKDWSKSRRPHAMTLKKTEVNKK